MPPATEPSLDRVAVDLQRATEALTTALLGELPPGKLVEAQLARDEAFRALRTRIEAGESLGETGRAALRMALALDAELIALGQTLQQAIAAERRDLGRRRRTIAAHARRERGLARALTVKA